MATAIRTVVNPSDTVRQIGTSRRLLFAVLVAGLALVLISALRFQAPELIGQHKVLTDFDAFHIAGRLAAQGRAADAYHFKSLLVAQREQSGTQSFMPWTYPPPFTLFMQGLAELPIGVAFAVFTLGSFAFYLGVLRKIAGDWLPATVMAIMPAVILNLRTGQNGFLIAGLIGCVLIAFEDKRALGGVPLGLMIIKPHLAVGIGLTGVLQRRWSTILVAGIVAACLLGAATWTYGVAIWSDFGDAVGEAAGFLAKGHYRFFRMSSIYASAFSLGLGATAAMVLQAVGAVGSLMVLGRACLLGLAYRHLAALTCCASLFVSPYGYDYDLTVLGVALAFVIPDLMQRCTGREILSLLVLMWCACGFGIGWNTVMAAIRPDAGVDLDADNAGLALIAPILLLICILASRFLRRESLSPSLAQSLLHPS